MLKKILAVIWQLIGAFAFIFGLIVFLSDIYFESYLFWAGLCSVACLIHVAYDWIIRRYVLWQNVTLLVASILAGPLVIWFYMYTSTKTLRARTEKKHEYDPYAGIGDTDPTPPQSTQTNPVQQYPARSTGAITQVQADKRTKKFGALDSALNSAISRVSLPDGRYTKIARKDLSVVSHGSTIKVYGSITYKIDHVGPERSVNEYKRDIEEAIALANKKLADAAINALEQVQDKYQGYDHVQNAVSDVRPKM